MPRPLTASDRKALIRLASGLPKGSEERRAILAGLKSAASWDDFGIFGTFFPVNQPHYDVDPENGKAFTLAEVQRYVGGYVEMLKVSGGKILLFDEEGSLKGLQPNREASKIAKRPIVGPALLVDKKSFR